MLSHKYCGVWTHYTQCSRKWWNNCLNHFYRHDNSRSKQIPIYIKCVYIFCESKPHHLRRRNWWRARFNYSITCELMALWDCSEIYSINCLVAASRHVVINFIMKNKPSKNHTKVLPLPSRINKKQGSSATPISALLSRLDQSGTTSQRKLA